MGRRWLLGLGLLALIATAIVTWRLLPRDPGPMAPPVTARELSQFDRFSEGSLTPLDGGSHSQAHRLWAYYRDQPPYQGVEPRLLGISRVELSGSSSGGVYWLVFSDHVYSANLGAEGGGDYGRQAVLVPDGSKSVEGIITLF
jgi:hypothetical protein